MPAGPRCLPVPERRNGERDKVREAICTASTESAVNQVISKRTVKNSRCAGTTRRPPPAPGPHPRPQRPARRRLPPLVPRPQPDTGPRRARSVASPRMCRLPKQACRYSGSPVVPGHGFLAGVARYELEGPRAVVDVEVAAETDPFPGHPVPGRVEQELQAAVVDAPLVVTVRVCLLGPRAGDHLAVDSQVHDDDRFGGWYGAEAKLTCTPATVTSWALYRALASLVCSGESLAGLLPGRPRAPRGGAARRRPLGDQLPLELGERGEDMEDQTAGAGGGVDPLVQRRERHPAIGQRVDGLHQMPKRPAQPVQPPHHQRVPGPQIPQAQRELRPLGQLPRRG